MSERPPHTEAEIAELVRSIDVQAPPELHRRIDALVGERGARPERASTRGRPPAAIRWGLAGALTLAAVAVVLIVSLSGGGSALTLHSAVALTLRTPTMAAPAQNPHSSTELAADVEGVAFPYWEDRFGWRSTGARVDHLAGRAVTTVFYARGRGRWLGYAIVGGASAPRVGGGVVREREGTPYRFQSVDGANVVTWLRDGHLCVMAGHGVSDATLMALASWREGGTLDA